MTDDAAAWDTRGKARDESALLPEHDWVVLKKTDPMDAEVLRAALETAEIPVVLKSEYVGRLYGLSSQKLGEVTVLVPREREAEARDLIENAVSVDFPESD
jgi:hypothetical protein